MPRRVAQGLDANRVAMLLAVLNRHAGVPRLQEHDVAEPMWWAASASRRRRGTGRSRKQYWSQASNDTPLPRSLIAFGELGLTGELRPVAYGEERLREAQKQGFTQALVAKDNAPRKAFAGLEVRVAGRIGEARAAAFSAHAASSASRQSAGANTRTVLIALSAICSTSN